MRNKESTLPGLKKETATDIDVGRANPNAGGILDKDCIKFSMGLLVQSSPCLVTCIPDQ